MSSGVISLTIAGKISDGSTIVIPASTASTATWTAAETAHAGAVFSRSQTDGSSTGGSTTSRSGTFRPRQRGDNGSPGAGGAGIAPADTGGARGGGGWK